MTWSILARDDQGRFGVAIASRFFAVGALCVHVQRGVGALSTQALMNPLYGPAGLALLAAGKPKDVASRLSTWVADHPKDSAAWRLLAVAYGNQNLSARAIRAQPYWHWP